VAGDGSQGKLELPWVRRAIMVQLATGNKTQAQISREYACSEVAISQFKKRHADEIEAIRENHLDQFTGIAIAQKAARLQAYEEILEKCLTPTPKMTGKEYVHDPKNGNELVYEIDANAAIKVLRGVAEELGHLPSRIVLAGGLEVKTNYTLNGVDPDNLK
jgi:hypothetical protein